MTEYAPARLRRLDASRTVAVVVTMSSTNPMRRPLTWPWNLKDSAMASPRSLARRVLSEGVNRWLRKCLRDQGIASAWLRSLQMRSHWLNPRLSRLNGWMGMGINRSIFSGSLRKCSASSSETSLPAARSPCSLKRLISWSTG